MKTKSFGHSLHLWFLLFIAASAGCSTDMPGIVPVSGVVTFQGGPCPAPGFIYLVPVPGKESRAQPGNARFEKDGKFTINSTAGNGLYPGEYQVRIDCQKELVSDDDPGVSLVPPNFAPANVVVPADSSQPIVVTIDVPGA